jgi:hypothetical protein
LLGNPDEGLPLRKKVHERLTRQKRAVALGERGKVSMMLLQERLLREVTTNNDKLFISNAA